MLVPGVAVPFDTPGVDTPGVAAPSVLLPAVVQAASTAEAAASEKLRRPKRGDEGFNEFSSNGIGGAKGTASRRDQAKVEATAMSGFMRAGGVCPGARTS
ncbi:MAG: hypothetical protein CPSOU_0554 [uncultured Paraburkholderia sp.]|nr:MAG: hypothetical protein CPSOU_0554 [uncultured Paraburkholderia sp.]